MNKKSILLMALLAVSPASIYAAVDLLGDEDCFGTNDVCTEDVTLPGGYVAVTSTVEDPAFTDTWNSLGSPVSWVHTLSTGSYSNTSLEIRTVGIADVAGPYQVLVDDVAVGEFPLDGFGHVLVETFEFPFDPSLLSDGSITVRFEPNPSDGWAIDYSKVFYESGGVSAPATPVPTLTNWALILLIVLMLMMVFANRGRLT